LELTKDTLRELYHGDEMKIRTSYLPFFHGLEAAFLRLAQSADGYVAWLSEASKVVRKAARYATEVDPENWTGC
jgi:hypothetical protein